MIRNISWSSMELDEIELVYEKAEANPGIASLMEQLEVQALVEAKNNVSMLKVNGGASLSPEQFDNLSDIDKETVIKVLGNAGISALNTEIQTATIIARFSPSITKVQACAIFNLLNRIEKLDGALTALIPEWTLKLQVPLGGKKGLSQWELLILQLYPWLSISEESTNEISVPPLKAANDESRKNSKHAGPNPFLEKMSKITAFTQSYTYAKAEMENAINKQLNFVPYWKDKLSLNEWRTLNEAEKFSKVLSLGSFAIVIDHCINIDFSEDIPNCIAIALLYLADSGKMPKQIIDAGEGTDTTYLIKALNAIWGCCNNWDCTIVYPNNYKIGVMASASALHPQGPNEVRFNQGKQKPKKSFWARFRQTWRQSD